MENLKIISKHGEREVITQVIITEKDYGMNEVMDRKKKEEGWRWIFHS